MQPQSTAAPGDRATGAAGPIPYKSATPDASTRPQRRRLPRVQELGLLVVILVLGTILGVYDGIREALAPFAEHGLKLRTHFSHWYEWGTMVYPRFVIADASGVFDTAWWWMFFPGMALVLTVVAFNLVGDGLRDALDPKSRA